MTNNLETEMQTASLTDIFQKEINYSFRDSKKLEQALRHKSFANEYKSLGYEDNERLEFLGDAVLDLALGDILMEKYPLDSEGSLSKRRASLVNEEALFELSKHLNLSQCLQLGKGEEASGGRNKSRILASALEAVFGAVYLDSNFEVAKGVIANLFETKLLITDGADNFDKDFKTRLQEVCQKKFSAIPVYEVISTRGLEHEKEFIVQVKIQERILGEGIGRTKKTAEQGAAQKALEELK